MRFLLNRRGFSMTRMARKLSLTRCQLIGGCLLLLCLMVFQPFRAVFMGPFIPTTWADTDTAHLYRVLWDFQDIPVPADGQPPSKLDGIYHKVQANLSEFSNYLARASLEYPEFWAHLRSLEALSGIDQKPLGQISIFQPALTSKEKAELMFAFDTFHRACRTAGITYFILEASLMGVLRHHGPIPWDDDIDVVVSVRQWALIRDVLGNIDGFELFTPPSSQWKFYMRTAHQFPNKPFKFPYVDIFFYDEDDTHVWALTRGLKHDLVYDKRDVFPLQYRPYAGQMVPVPCNLDLIVTKAHDKNKCVTPEYNHKVNLYETIRAVDCGLLYNLYPFVFADKPSSSGYVTEHLRIGDVEVHQYNLTTGCPKVA